MELGPKIGKVVVYLMEQRGERQGGRLIGKVVVYLMEQR